MEKTVRGLLKRIRLALGILFGSERTAYDEDDRIGWRKWT